MDRSAFRRFVTSPVGICLAVNLVLWVVAFVDLARHAVYFPPSFQTGEGPYPQVIFNWGLPLGIDPMSYVGFKVVFFADVIPWLPVNALFHLFFGEQQYAPRVMGTTTFGFQMIVWFIVSFVQWYVIGILWGWWRRMHSSPIAA